MAEKWLNVKLPWQIKHMVYNDLLIWIHNVLNLSIHGLIMLWLTPIWYQNLGFNLNLTFMENNDIKTIPSLANLAKNILFHEALRFYISQCTIYTSFTSLQ